jgi:hypothetical protein
LVAKLIRPKSTRLTSAFDTSTVWASTPSMLALTQSSPLVRDHCVYCAAWEVLP